MCSGAGRANLDVMAVDPPDLEVVKALVAVVQRVRQHLVEHDDLQPPGGSLVTLLNSKLFTVATLY